MSNARLPDIYNLCQFQFANKRLCGMPAHPKGDGMCLNHFRHVNAKPAPREDDLSAELASPAGDFICQIDINHVLGNLFQALAANRITPRRASSLAYIAALMTQTQIGAFDEARRWEIDAPVFKKILKLKNPKLDLDKAIKEARARQAAAQNAVDNPAPDSTPAPAVNSAKA
jgi:hypothetical protein